MKNLAVQDDFSYFDVLSRSPHITTPYFGVFLTEGDSPDEEAEIAFGGINKNKVLEEVKWNNVVNVDIGYWQVRIVAVRVGGVKLDVCDDGTCRGVVDTGTSHLGLPVPWNEEINAQLTSPAEDYLDCRLKNGPLLEFELDSINLTLSSWNYMRRLPIREGIQVGSTHGVSDAVPPSADNTANGSLMNSTNSSNESEDEGNTSAIDLNATNVTRFCRPRTMAVNLSEPVGPKFFILGEPVLHKFYTVYDWEKLRVGFALANNKRNTGPPTSPDDRGVLPDDVELLMQKKSGMILDEDEDDDEPEIEL
jgi:cathepsin D